ncbi:MAG: NYN domain-containing protein [Candidatus Euphemobacter frigidus]|nr:NYN domain-containing protein [Candidatus Euphemobacter frigidus]MDP8275470.1 NYN domain-containing protein [Candidatus Euphemobacter frigidus]
MKWLIDGYNVLISNELGHDNSARERFRRLIEAYFSGKQVEVTIVYDSRGSITIQRERLTSSISAVYVDNADQYIIDMIEGSSHPRSIILVTDDRDIVQAVRDLRPQRRSTAEFLSLITPSYSHGWEEKKPERETQGNIERYLSLFDMESDD